MNTTLVIATHRVVGFHAWPDAPPEVAYLGSLHRHIFKVRVEAAVYGLNREVEFHMLKRVMIDQLRIVAAEVTVDGEHRFGAMSCEMIALRLGLNLKGVSYSISAVECWEDDENGSRVEWLAAR